MKGGLTLLMLLVSIMFCLLNAWNAGNMLDNAIKDGQPVYLVFSAIALWVCFDLGKNIQPLTQIFIIERNRK